MFSLIWIFIVCFIDLPLWIKLVTSLIAITSFLYNSSYNVCEYLGIIKDSDK